VSVRVRPMTERDARVVADLAGQLGYPSTQAQIQKRFETVSGDEGSAVFVAEVEDGRVIGWVHVIVRTFLESDAYAELAGLVVDGTVRRQGAGQALVSAAETWAAGRGYTTMRVRSNIKRIEARSFYEGRGYVIGKSQHVYEKLIK